MAFASFCIGNVKCSSIPLYRYWQDHQLIETESLSNNLNGVTLYRLILFCALVSSYAVRCPSFYLALAPWH